MAVIARYGYPLWLAWLSNVNVSSSGLRLARLVTDYDRY